MEYIIRQNPDQEHFFDIELHIEANTEWIELQLPAWRPGRYELQNFAKNIQHFAVFDQFGDKIPFTKKTKDKWQVQVDQKNIIVKYSYYANQQDAGNSFVDKDIFYLNFVNCLPYIVGKINEPSIIMIEMPSKWAVACALPFIKTKIGVKLSFSNYYQLADSPFLATKTIETKQYTVESTDFYIHIAGNYTPNWPKILADFKAFTVAQIIAMGAFPEKEYHFIIWILPTAYYHGVEHGNSTMIVLGPDIEGDTLLTDLLGVCSHELYHAWNICKIRPQEMLPYDFTKENYFDTGFVAEGVTTYFGDLFLKHSRVFSKEEYLKELNTVFIRHFTKNGLAKQSLVESSIDLWLDGYAAGIPNKKVSIYYKGAIVALILDLMIRLKHDHQKSLFTVMKTMWENFGKPVIGYKLTDYKQIAEETFGENLDQYFNNCVFGNINIEAILCHYLKQIGLEIIHINTETLALNEIKKATKIQKYNLDKFLNDI
jgi:predicted metalloprotease with PDZ domain